MELTAEKRRIFADRLERACIAKYGKKFGIASKLARDMDVSVNTTARWVRGEVMPDSDRWGLLANTLGVTTQWLLGATNEPPESVASLDKESANLVSGAAKIVFPLIMKLRPEATEAEIVELTTHAYNQIRAGVPEDHVSGEIVARIFSKQ